MKKIIYSSFLILTSLISCSLRDDETSKLSQNFYYTPSKGNMLEEFKYEWVFSDSVFPWKIYYGLAFWRPKAGEKIGFTIPYFLIKNEKEENNLPPSFIISDDQGSHWHFKTINNEKDFDLVYEEQTPISLEEFQHRKEENIPFNILVNPPFKGRVYILDYTKNRPFDWALLKILYENSIDKEYSFTFIWEQPSQFAYEDSPIVQPDKIMFKFYWEKKGFQTFMKALKEWGIS